MNKILFLLPLTLAYSLHGALNKQSVQSDFIPLHLLDSAAPEHRVNWKLVIRQQHALETFEAREKEFKNDQAKIAQLDPWPQTFITRFILTIVTMAFNDFLAAVQELKLEQKNELLLNAAQKGFSSIVRALLANDAQVDFVNEFGSTALIKACTYGHAAVAQLLITRGANVNSADAHLNTVLMIACMYGHTAVVAVLLDNDADVSCTNNDEQTARDLAIDAEIIALLDKKSHE